MKFYATLLALSVIAPAAAFVPTTSSFTRNAAVGPLTAIPGPGQNNYYSQPKTSGNMGSGSIGSSGNMGNNNMGGNGNMGSMSSMGKDTMKSTSSTDSSTSSMYGTSAVPLGGKSTKVLEDRIAFLEGQLGGRTGNGNGSYVQANGRSGNQEMKFWENASYAKVEGNSLKTWAVTSNFVENVQLRLSSEGRPVDASIELWQGPDNTPVKIRAYVEDGNKRPFTCMILTPRGPNTVAIRNTGQLEFPFSAAVLAVTDSEGGPLVLPKISYSRSSMTIQGGALKTYPFDPLVERVQVLIRTDGRPLNARIELLQGPNNNKQVVEVYTEDGLDRPFFIVLDTPGSGNVVRLVNMSPVEFPMSATVEPYLVVNDRASSSRAVLGGDSQQSNFWQG